jgi:ectoine hydroxylase-related dioxygenase (phytanoyl-CoA dioxygenase family)
LILLQSRETHFRWKKHLLRTGRDFRDFVHEEKKMDDTHGKSTDHDFRDFVHEGKQMDDTLGEHSMIPNAKVPSFPESMDTHTTSGAEASYQWKPMNEPFATKKQQKPRPVVQLVGYTLRTILLDLPLFVVLLTYAATVWFRHVQNNYLAPQLEALVFSDERSVQENTYYKRVCDVSDMTTTEGADLFLPLNATSEEAYQHQLKHGFTVFKGILKPETCDNLRNFVVSRNHQLDKDEAIYVIENENRYSFGLGTEEPSVTEAMKELANSPRLRPALEAILGPDPALIEMTAITIAYGAVAQWWHDDVVAPGSAIQFARTFGPSYSVFVQLQNTTKEMGATGACPGTHFCSEGPMEVFCETNGFQMVGDDGFWGQGDALLMNMNSWHRGGAHTDPDALDRVMLILTFVPKPMTRAESRQLSQGITFSLRWDMWGHTLNDLAAADTAMSQPWATLRALGLCKSKTASWGIDYVTSASIRAANQDNGFRTDELEEWIEKGGFKFLPDWLENFEIDWDEGESWPAYIQGTQKLCEEFAEKVSKYAIAGYLALFFVFSLFPGQQHRLRCACGAVVRLSLIGVTVYLLFQTAKTRVDRTGWAADIRAGRRYASTVEIERAFAKGITGPSTYPTRDDVLIETRYGSKQLAMYNDFVKTGHPGNQFFRELVEKAAPVYGGYNHEFKHAAALFIAETVVMHHGRFLFQGPDGYWIWLDYKNAIDYVEKELAIASNDMVAALMQTARFVVSNYKYGVFRGTALAIDHAVPFMETLQKKLLKETSSSKSKDPRPTRGKYLKYFRTFWLPSAKSNARRVPRKESLFADPLIEPPYLGAWLAENDAVEAFEDNGWYFCVILFVNAQGDYEIEYPDGTSATVDQYSIRPFEEYQVGEQVMCYIENEGDYDWCTVRQIFSDGTYFATSDDTGEELVGLTLGDCYRVGEQMRTKHIFMDNYH